MIERSYIHVGGPSGAGKTIFIERVLKSARHDLLVARCSLSDAVRKPRESAPSSHPELKRYRKAGAPVVAKFVFAAGNADDFFETDLLSQWSQAVLLEGDSPLRFVDLRVFVAHAPANGSPLYVNP